MGSLSNYAEDKILDHLVGKTEFTMPTMYVALCTADPTDAGTGAAMNELADANAYARVETAGGDWDASSGGAIANAAAITFTAASGGDWAEATHFAVLDSGTHGAGNMLGHGALDVARTVTEGDVIRFAIGALDITLD